MAAAEGDTELSGGAGEEPPPAGPPSDPEGEPAPRRTLSDRGQPLVAVPPEKRKRRMATKAKPPAPVTRDYQSIDDVLKKHADRPPHTPDDELPPDEPDPARRDRATYGRIELMPDVLDPEEPAPGASAEPPRRHSRDDEPPEPDANTLRTLEDLCARFDLDGTGQFFIMVTRQQPRAYAGTATYGRMRNIDISMSHEEFCLAYGGGQYIMQVYGPPKRGGIIDPKTLKPKKKALSKTITLTIPWEGENGLPPNPMAAIDPFENEEEPHMSQGASVTDRLTSRRVNTLADAKIIETHTQKELTMDERQRQERREEVQQRRQAEAAAVDVLKESKDETIRMQQARIEELSKEVRAMNGSKSNGSDVVHAVAQMATALQRPQANSDELQRMREGYEERLASQREAYEQRLKDLTERHKRELEDRERVLQRDKEDGVRRAEEAARIAEQHRAQDVQQVIKDRDREREDAKKDLERQKADQERERESLKREHERDIARQKEQYENLLRAEKESNERERRTTEQLTATKADLVKSTVESELRTATAEVARLRADNERLKTELDKKSNLPKQLKEFSDAAESLGFNRDEGGGKEEPASWQDLLLKGGISTLEKLPEIMKNAGELLQIRQNANRPPPPPPGAMGPPPMLPQGPRHPPMQPVTHAPPLSGWATEDSPHNPMPVAEFYEPALPQSSHPPVVVQQHQPPMPTPAQVAMAPAPPPSAPQPSVPPPPRPTTPPPGETAPPPAAAPAITDEQIMQFVPVVEQWFSEQAASPEDYARHAATQAPILKVLAHSLTPEAIAAALRRNGHGLSPLIRRDGQRFLTRFRAALLDTPKERPTTP